MAGSISKLAVSVNLGQGAYIIKDPQSSEVKLEVRQAELPSPERAFYSSAFAIDSSASHLQMSFCQMVPGSEASVNAAVIIHVSVGDVKNLLTTSKEFFRSLHSRCEQLGVSGHEGYLKTGISSVPNDRVVQERANIMALAFTGSDAEIRFYKIAAHDLSRVLREEKPKRTSIVFPVLQIDLPLCNLCSLSRVLHELVPEEDGDQ